MMMIAVGVAAAPLAMTTTAYAGPKECVAAADEGQKLRDDSKLNAAREKFIMCAAKACPGAVSKQCSQWLIETEKDMPTMTFRALDDQGKETIEVKVLVDGAKVSDTIDAHALALDPGEHKVRYERADGRSVEEKILLRPGEKNRLIELTFQVKTVAPPEPVKPVTPPPPPPDVDHGFRIPLLGWVGLGVGVVGGVMTVAFAMSANSSETDLRSTCAPRCDPSLKSSIDTKVALANVGFVVGVTGLGVAVVSTVLANTGNKSEQPVAKSSAVAPKSSVALDVTPGSVILRGSF
ncbi:MAG: hypothetical protein QOI41_1373 [Myxococcales bacterium]|nr:hypothetical protein [Myxococcales bacterium]